jgi:DNA-binding beta-propeller fold protein YncE
MKTPHAKLLVRTLLIAAVATLSTSPLQAATPTPQPRFHIQNQWVLGGTGGWGHLFFDASTHQLYIPRTNRVMIVDANTGKLSGELDGLISARDIALDNAGRFAYVTDLTDGTAGFVRVFDRTTYKLIATIPVGINPDTLVLEPRTGSVFAFNTRSHTASVIDSATNQIAATIDLPARPTSAVADGSGSIFVSIPALGQITRIDAASNKLTASFNLAPCTGPTGLAIDAPRHQLLTTCEDHTLVSINTATGHVTPLAKVEAGSGDMNFDPGHNLLFITDSSGMLSIFRRDSSIKYSRLQQVKTQPGARTMILDPQDARAYLVTSHFGQNTATASEELKFRPTPVPRTFSVIVVGR